jgi:hypothetical protein
MGLAAEGLDLLPDEAIMFNFKELAINQWFFDDTTHS